MVQEEGKISGLAHEFECQYEFKLGEYLFKFKQFMLITTIEVVPPVGDSLHYNIDDMVDFVVYDVVSPFETFTVNVWEGHITYHFSLVDGHFTGDKFNNDKFVETFASWDFNL